MNDDLQDWPPPLSLAFTGVGGVTWMYSPRASQTAERAFGDLTVAERGALVGLAKEIVATFEGSGHE